LRLDGAERDGFKALVLGCFVANQASSLGKQGKIQGLKLCEVFDRAGLRTYDTRPMSRPQAEPITSSTEWIVDAVVQAHGGLTWERKFSGMYFERLVDLAVSAKPGGSIKLKFSILDQRPVIHGELVATVDLVCQRCMGVVQHPLQETFELMLAATEAELALVPESHEPWIVNASRLNVLELVEEQLLLALPLIAKHVDESSCVKVEPQLAALLAASQLQVNVPTQDAASEVQHPFGQLRDLLRKP
jgi:uncharacterized protein